MGAACLSGKKSKYYKSIDLTAIPNDINQFESKNKHNLPKSKYIAVLCNVKIQNYQKV